MAGRPSLPELSTRDLPSISTQWALISAFIHILIGLVSSTQTLDAFTWNNETFLLHGQPYRIIGGQTDPQRVPNELWGDRPAKARAMGLYTIFSYTCWNELEPAPGAWDTSGNNDLARYFQIAQEQGLNVVLRPGPYICGEHEWGGFPAWLGEIPGMVVRANNKPFLAAAKAYIDRLSKQLEPLRVTNGVPILMVQVENEYGSYGDDHTYVATLRDMFKQAFQLPLYTGWRRQGRPRRRPDPRCTG